jgi:hypothetical protein
VRFNFPPLKMFFKKNLTTQQAVGGSGVEVGGLGKRDNPQTKKKKSHCWKILGCTKAEAASK